MDLPTLIVEGMSLGLTMLAFFWLITLPIGVFIRMLGW